MQGLVEVESLTETEYLKKYSELQKKNYAAILARQEISKAEDEALIELTKKLHLEAMKEELVKIIATLIIMENNPMWYGQLEYRTSTKAMVFAEYIQKKWVLEFFKENIWKFLIKRGKEKKCTDEEILNRYHVFASFPHYENHLVVTIDNFDAEKSLKKLLAEEELVRQDALKASGREEKEAGDAKEKAIKQEFKKNHPWLTFIFCY